MKGPSKELELRVRLLEELTAELAETPSRPSGTTELLFFLFFFSLGVYFGSQIRERAA